MTALPSIHLKAENFPVLCFLCCISLKNAVFTLRKSAYRLRFVGVYKKL